MASNDKKTRQPLLERLSRERLDIIVDDAIMDPM